jgi:hypothetical protein
MFDLTARNNSSSVFNIFEKKMMEALTPDLSADYIWSREVT